MPRTYTISGGQSVAAAATETGLSLGTPGDLVMELLSVRCGQQTHETAEQYLLEILRASDAGSGGTTPTPAPRDEGDVASSVTVQDGPSTEPTYTGEPLFSREWNSTLGMEKVFTEKERPLVSPSSFIGGRVTAIAGAVTFTMVMEFTFQEIGG